jgi:hypothetical protein
MRLRQRSQWSCRQFDSGNASGTAGCSSSSSAGTTCLHYQYSNVAALSTDALTLNSWSPVRVQLRLQQEAAAARRGAPHCGKFLSLENVEAVRTVELQGSSNVFSVIISNKRDDLILKADSPVSVCVCMHAVCCDDCSGLSACMQQCRVCVVTFVK